MQNNDQFIITEENADGTTAEYEITTEQQDAGDGTMIDGIVDALFDDTSTEVTATLADTDGDGKLDAAAMDTDGDGVIDSVFVDTDGDGMLDTAASDVDGDGKIDLIATDTDGDGKLDAAIVDSDGDGGFDTVMTDSDGDGEFETVEEIDGDQIFLEEASAGLPSDEELSMDSVEFNLGDVAFSETEGAEPEQDSAITAEEYTAADPGYAAEEDYPVTDQGYMAAENMEPLEAQAEAGIDPAVIEQEANAEAARDAQAAADEFADAGDYRAAADARAEAEALSGDAGDSSMLGVYDEQDYAYAADKQEEASAFQAEQAEKIAAGDYEGARDAAFNAEWATRDADMTAGGADHTGQAQADQASLDWATYQQENADSNMQDAAAYAAEGDFEKAEMYAYNAESYQASADGHAEQADPNSIMYDVDHSSVVDTGGTYDASTAGFDAGGGYDMGAVDTGFDSSVDMSSPAADSGLDDGTL